VAVGRLVREMAVGFAIDANASAGKWVEGGNEIVFVGVGFAVLLRGSHDARAIAGGGLGLLGLSAGMLNAAALTNGVVLSALPSAMARAAVVVTIRRVQRRRPWGALPHVPSRRPTRAC
jgi:hypothetical protein